MTAHPLRPLAGRRPHPVPAPHRSPAAPRPGPPRRHRSRLSRQTQSPRRTSPGVALPEALADCPPNCRLTTAATRGGMGRTTHRMTVERKRHLCLFFLSPPSVLQSDAVPHTISSWGMQFWSSNEGSISFRGRWGILLVTPTKGWTVAAGWLVTLANH